MSGIKKKILLVTTIVVVAVIAVVCVVLKGNNSFSFKKLCADGFESATIKPYFSVDTYTLSEKELSIFTAMLKDIVVYKEDPSPPSFVGMSHYIEITKRNKEQIQVELINHPDTPYVIVDHVWYPCILDGVDNAAVFIGDLFNAHCPH